MCGDTNISWQNTASLARVCFAVVRRVVQLNNPVVAAEAAAAAGADRPPASTQFPQQRTCLVSVARQQRAAGPWRCCFAHALVARPD